MDFIEPCFGIGHNLSLICQMTSEDIKHQLIIIIVTEMEKKKKKKRKKGGGGGGGEKRLYRYNSTLRKRSWGGGEVGGGGGGGGWRETPQRGCKKKRDKCYCNGKQTEVCIVVWV